MVLRQMEDVSWATTHDGLKQEVAKITNNVAGTSEEDCCLLLRSSQNTPKLDVSEGVQHDFSTVYIGWRGARNKRLSILTLQR